MSSIEEHVLLEVGLLVEGGGKPLVGIRVVDPELHLDLHGRRDR